MKSVLIVLLVASTFALATAPTASADDCGDPRFGLVPYAVCVTDETVEEVGERIGPVGNDLCILLFGQPCFPR